jgi:alkanesulfonate monooxygenase SsuD/methylene tetrahydromethanopterin reductase-like flavin-dependent oxidoreductase (luciferase family)
MTFRHPSLLARMAAQVDVLSGGRLELGVGAGWNAVEHSAFGIPFPPTKTRMDMLEEGIQVIRALLRDSPANFNGEIYRIEDAECYPRPVQSPLPIVVGGTGERRTLKIAARYADHWNAVGVGLSEYPHKREVLERHCADVGRNPNEIRRSLMCGFVIGRDAAGIEDHFRRVANIISLEQAAAGSSIRQLRDSKGWLAGTPSEIVEQVKAWEALGVEEVMLQHLDHKGMDVLELIASEIIPNVA